MLTEDGKHLYVSYDEYHNLIEKLALKVYQSGWEFDTILCLARGGMRPGDILSRIFDKPLAIMSTSSYRADAGTVQGKLDIARYITTPKGEIAGKVLLVVNTASYCGFTKQYEGLEALFAKYRDQGLVILGFPSNDFEQETGDAKQIAELCFNTYGVRFPMFDKTVVTGAKANPLYLQLRQATGVAPRWNFHKYLIGRDGRVIEQYPSATEPMGRTLTKAVEAALTAKA